MNNSSDRTKKDDTQKNPSVHGDSKQGKVDPQLSELDGLKKGGVEPVVHQSDKPRDEKGKTDK